MKATEREQVLEPRLEERCQWQARRRAQRSSKNFQMKVKRNSKAVVEQRLRRCPSRGRVSVATERRAYRWDRGRCQTGIFASRQRWTRPTFRSARRGNSRRVRARTEFRKYVQAWALFAKARGANGAISCSISFSRTLLWRTSSKN